MPSPYSSAGTRRDAARAREEPRHRVPAPADHRRLRGVPPRPRQAVQGAQGGRDRGEPPGPHPRQLPDGAVEQVRMARAHHRQQERDRGRATPRSTATWRAASPSSRTCPRRSSTSSPSTPIARAGRELIPRSIFDRPPIRRAPPGPDRPGLAAALCRARRHPRGLRRGRPGRSPRSSARGFDEPHRQAGDRHGGPQRVQAPAGRPSASRSPRAPSARTGGCRSSTSSGSDADPRRTLPRGVGAGRGTGS